MAAGVVCLLVSGCGSPGADGPPVGDAPAASASPVAAGPGRPTSSPVVRQVDRPLRVVGLGDSVMAGTGCDCDGPMQSLADRLGATGFPAEARDFGSNGATTAYLNASLQWNAGVRSAVESADVVVVISGANDLQAALRAQQGPGCDQDCAAGYLADMKDGLGAALAHVRDLRGDRPTTYLVAGYWNVFPDGPTGHQALGPDTVQWSRALTRDANAAIREAAEAHGMRYVDLYAPFHDATGADLAGLLAADGDHPNAAGVALIGQVLADAAR